MRNNRERERERRRKREGEGGRERERERERERVDARWPMLPLLCAILFSHLRILSGLLLRCETSPARLMPFTNQRDCCNVKRNVYTERYSHATGDTALPKFPLD